MTEHGDLGQLTEEELRQEVELLLAELGRVTSPEETLAYVVRLAERMQVELEEP